jgi:hypothetical protein
MDKDTEEDIDESVDMNEELGVGNRFELFDENEKPLMDGAKEVGPCVFLHTEGGKIFLRQESTGRNMIIEGSVALRRLPNGQG